MMTQLTALYFPDTEITVETVAQELLFFEKIIYYRSVENGEAKEEVPGADTLCHGYAPVPFGEDLNRFKSLLKDLKGHENEFYSGQLSAISSGQVGKRDTTSVTDLISTITKSNCLAIPTGFAIKIFLSLCMYILYVVLFIPSILLR